MIEPISKEQLTRETILEIAKDNSLLYAAVTQWQHGSLTWDEAMIYAVWAMHRWTKKMGEMLHSGLSATMPKMEIQITGLEWESFIAKNNLAIAAPEMLACLEKIELYEPVEDDCAFCGAERYRSGYRHDDDCLGVRIAAVIAEAKGIEQP